MKKKFFKSTLAVVMVAAAAFGGVKTYYSYIQPKESILLSENIEAMSDDGDPWYQAVKCYMNDANSGVDAIICPDGTQKNILSTCPNETKKANYYSAQGYCLVRVK